MQSILAKYALRLEVADVFSQKGRRLAMGHLEDLLEETRQVVRKHLELLEPTLRQKRDQFVLEPNGAFIDGK